MLKALGKPRSGLQDEARDLTAGDLASSASMLCFQVLPYLFVETARSNVRFCVVRRDCLQLEELGSNAYVVTAIYSNAIHACTYGEGGPTW
jgi:hypothetical protein